MKRPPATDAAPADRPKEPRVEPHVDPPTKRRWRAVLGAGAALAGLAATALGIYVYAPPPFATMAITPDDATVMLLAPHEERATVAAGACDPGLTYCLIFDNTFRIPLPRNGVRIGRTSSGETASVSGLRTLLRLSGRSVQLLRRVPRMTPVQYEPISEVPCRRPHPLEIRCPVQDM